ncbi:MAG: hypothetical protein J6X55_17200 [Victivallales bacterium]|nr:hypothetical protein [Victivallales bacterium]
MNTRHFRSILPVIVLAAMFVSYQAFSQDMGPEMMGPDGGGAPQQPAFDPDNPPPKPVKPEEPKPLEPDMGWLDTRKQLTDLYDGIIDAQFGDMRRRLRPTANPLLQRFREYWSEKNIVSEWSRTRPLGNDWTYPIPEVTEDIKEINETLTRELEEEAIQKFPDKTTEQYLAEGERIFALYRRGDMVEFTLAAGGRGVSSKVRGKLREVQKNVIKLEPRKIFTRTDLPREVAARFFVEDHAAMVKEYAAKGKLACELNRKNYVHVQFLRRMPERLVAANYVPDHIRFGESFTTKIFKLEQWVSRKYLVMERQRQQWEANTTPRTKMEANMDARRDPGSIGANIFSVFMDGQGFKWITAEESARLGQALRKDEVNRHIGWVPKQDIADIENKIREIESYPEKLEKYKSDLARYEDWVRQKKEYDAQGGGAGAGAEDDDD